jgi:hypothetical protein
MGYSQTYETYKSGVSDMCVNDHIYSTTAAMACLSTRAEHWHKTLYILPTNSKLSNPKSKRQNRLQQPIHPEPCLWPSCAEYKRI